MRSPYHLLIENGTRLLVSSCEKILGYSPEKIEIQLKGGRILICGSALSLCDFCGDELKIGGVIEKVILRGDGGEI